MKYESYKVVDLKNICNARGLSDQGNKQQLISRLKANEENREIEIEFNDIQDLNKKEDAKTLFIQLKSANLFYYFNSGIFYPLELEKNLIYRNENRKDDMFHYFPEHIILSKQALNHFESDEVLIEIIINDLKINQINNVDLYYIEDPIPISRVKAIFFKTAQLVKSFLASTKVFPDSYIPEELCKILPMNFEIMNIDISNITIETNKELYLWKTKLEKFDKIMGIFSFMKNSSIFSSTNDNQYQQYPNRYIALLGLINKKLALPDQKDIGLFKYILYPFEIEETNSTRLLFKEIIDKIYNNIEFDYTIAQNIIQNVIISNLSTLEEKKDLQLIIDALIKLEKHQISFKEILNLEIVGKNYPILALLFLTKFSNKSKQHTDKQAVRVLLISNELNFNKSVTEFILSVLGLYYGYNKMIKSDTNLKLNDINFDAIAEKQQSIKFKLENNLDRISIESIFEFCKFQEVQNYDYPYLKVKKVKPYIKDQIKKGNFEYFDNSFIIYDTIITSIKRVNKIDDILKSIELNYPNYIDNKSVLLNFLINNGIIHKKILLELVKNSSNALFYEELIGLIEFDKKRNKIR